MAMLHPDDPKGVDMQTLLDRAKREGLRERARREAQRKLAEQADPHPPDKADDGIVEVCSPPVLEAFMRHYRMVYEVVGGSLGTVDVVERRLDTSPPARQHEAVPASPWLAKLQTIRDLLSRTKKAPAVAAPSDSQLASARRAIYSLAASAESPDVRRAAVCHLVKTFSDEKQRAIKYGLESLERAANMKRLSKFDRTECAYDQDFLNDIACNADCAKDRFVALDQLQDETAVQEYLLDIACSGASAEHRVIALKRLQDERAVAAIAIADNNLVGRVAEAALEQLTDQDRIVEVARQATDVTVQCKAVKQIESQNVLRRLARRNPAVGVRLAATRRLSVPRTLAKVGLRDPDPDVRQAAVDRIDNPKVLRKAALNDGEPSVRQRAVQRITDAQFLGRVAIHDADPGVRLLAVERIQDQSVLSSVATTDTDHKVRTEAVRQLTEMH